jgi:peroxiredoxin
MSRSTFLLDEKGIIEEVIRKVDVKVNRGQILG